MKLKTIVTALGFMAVFSASAYAQNDTASVLTRLKELYPSTQFTGIRQSEIAGLYEVRMRKNIAYTDKSGRYFLMGHLFDMKNQVDLTAERLAEANKVDFDSLPLQDAFQRVIGKGSRKLVLFSDPDCPFCKRLETELAKLDDVTIYTFPYPIAQLHPDAKRKVIAMWCAEDKAKAWDDFMNTGKVPQDTACEHPADRNVALANRLGINGTPTMILANGRRLSGAMPAAELEKAISSASGASAVKVSSSIK